MIGNSCLLDTSIIINAFRRNNAIALELEQMSEVFVPVIVIGELCFGAYNSTDSPKHLRQLQLFLSRCTILSIDQRTADYYGKIKARLIQKGKPIPENDIWIAAAALQINLPLYTNDSHFKEVDGLTLL